MSTTEVLPRQIDLYTRFEQRLDELSRESRSPDQYIIALRKAYEETQDDTVKKKIRDEYVKPAGEAVRQWTSLQENYRGHYGDPARLTEQFKIAPETLDPELRSMAGELSDFRTFFGGFKGAYDPKRPGAETASHSTALGLWASTLGLDQTKDLKIQGSLGVSPTDVNEHALDRKLSRAPKELQAKVEADPNLKDLLARYSRASDLYLQMGAQRDAKASELVATGQVANFQTAQDVLQGWLEDSHSALEGSEKELVSKYGSLGRLSTHFLPVPRSPKAGFLGVLEDAARSWLEFVAPVVGLRASSMAGIMFPRKKPSEHVSVADLAKMSDETRKLLPPGVKQLSEIAIIPMNVQTMTEDMAVLLGPIGAQFRVASVPARMAGKAVASVLPKTVLGGAIGGAARGAVLFGGAEVVSPNVPLGDIGERGKRVAIGGAVGAGLGAVGGALRGVKQPAPAAPVKPQARQPVATSVPERPVEMARTPELPSVPETPFVKTAPGYREFEPPVLSEGVSRFLPIHEEAQFIGPASRFGKSVFRETNVQDARDFLGRSLGEVDDLYVANTRNLALGQGRNKGVLIEFDTEGIPQTTASFKPGSRAVYETTGETEILVKYSSYEKLRPHIKSVTIAPGVKGDPVSNVVVKRALSGWTKEELPDGSIRYTPPAKPAPAAPKAAPKETPAAASDTQALVRGTKFATESGEPTRFYHGTSQPFDDVLSATPSKRTTGGGFNKHGVFVSPDPKAASRYAADFPEGGASRVIPSYVFSKKPLQMSAGDYERLQSLVSKIDSKAALSEMEELSLEKILPGYKIDSAAGISSGHPIDWIKWQGYDSIAKAAGRGGAEAEVLVFESSNVVNALSSTAEKAALPAAEEMTQQTTGKIIEAIKAAKPVRAEQEALYTAERAKRMPEVLKARGTPGEAGFALEKEALKGELPKADFSSIRDKFSQEERDSLYQRLKDSPLLGFWEKIGAQDALSRMFDPIRPLVPQDNQIEKLARVFGPEFGRELSRLKGGGDERVRAAVEALGAFKTLKSGFDFSMLRQATFLATTFPKETAKAAFRDQFKFWAKEKNLNAMHERIVADPNFEKWKKAGLALTSLSEGTPNLLGREEQFIAANFLERLATKKGVAAAPGRALGGAVRASDRAFTGGLTQLRYEAANEMLRRAEGAGLQPTDALFKKVANYVNVYSGRGNLPGLERSATALAAALFSPRFVSSRLSILMNPQNYVTGNAVRKRLTGAAAKAFPVLSPEEVFVRKTKLYSALSTVAAGSAFLTTLSQIPGVKVGMDPRSSDFGKVKMGKTRFDVWGGLQQPAVAAWRIINGESVSPTTGKVQKLGKGYGARTGEDVFIDFFLNKAAPVPNALLDLMRRKKQFGEPLTPKAMAKDLLAPMIYEDIADIAKTDPWLLPGAIPAITMGIGVQTFPVGDPALEALQLASREGKDKTLSVKNLRKRYNAAKKLKGKEREEAMRAVGKEGEEVLADLQVGE